MSHTCEACGSSPAAKIKLRRGVGLVLVHRTYTADVYLCGDCAKRATSEFQKETLKKGWTSPRSALANPFLVAGNAFNKSRHQRRLANETASGYSNNGTAQLSSDGAHPIDLLAAFTPKDSPQREIFANLLLDFTGGGIVSKQSAVNAIRRVPERAESEVFLETASSLVEAAKVGGNIAEGLVHASFVVEMERLTNIPLADYGNAHRGLATAMSESVHQLVRAGRQDEALGVAYTACILFSNIKQWELAQIAD
jgi:hypothetical protein